MLKFSTLKLNQVETRILILFCLLVLSKIIIAIGLNLHDPNKSVLNESNYAQFDAGHYLSIAESGYECFKCYTRFGDSWPKDEWCGNTGWFPGYPLTIKLINLIIHDYPRSAFLLNHFFVVAILLLLFRFFEFYGKKIKSALLLVGLLCPGFIYYYAIFPLSGTLFFLLLSIYGFIKKIDILTFVGIFCATIYYPTGILVIIPLIMTSVLLTNDIRKSIISGIYLYILPAIVGLAFVIGIMYIDTQHLDAYIKVSSKYENHLHFPFTNMWNQITSLFNFKNLPETKNIQSSLCIIGIMIISCINFKRYLKGSLSQLEIFSTLYILTYLFIPWSLAGDFSSYRSESLLLPFILCFKSYDTKFIVILIIIFAALGVSLSYDFFEGKII